MVFAIYGFALMSNLGIMILELILQKEKKLSLGANIQRKGCTSGIKQSEIHRNGY